MGLSINEIEGLNWCGKCGVVLYECALRANGKIESEGKSYERCVCTCPLCKNKIILYEEN